MKTNIDLLDGSFSENMYGLRRTKLLQVDSKQLSRSDKNWSLFFLIVVPYLKDKTDVWFNRNYARNTSLLRAGDIDMDEEVDESVQRRKSRLKRVFDYIISAFYPLFNAFYEGLFFVYQLLYLYHHTPYYTPFLHMQNLVVSRLSQMDYALQQYRTSRPRNETGIKYILTKLLDTWNLSLDFAKYFLPLAVFFFKFLEWWYSEERLSGTVNKPIPPPPELPKQAFGGIPVPDQKNLCPLCRNERENPAIAISGFAFCYPCIYNYVLEHKRCPITLIPSDLDQIRKVYDQND